MLSADLALALLINRTTHAYQQNPPAYIAYREQTHISVPALGRQQDINRSVVVRQADDYAIMRDLPNGGERSGQAFPIIPYFDPFSNFEFDYYANLKNVTITLTRGSLSQFPIPATDPSVDAVIPYASFWTPHYDPRSNLHIIIDPTPRITGFYPNDVVEDPQTQLPSHIEMRTLSGDETVALDYKIIDGHWVIVHGTFTSAQHFGLGTINIIADVTYDQFTFPATSPDPRL